MAQLKFYCLIFIIKYCACLSAKNVVRDGQYLELSEEVLGSNSSEHATINGCADYQYDRDYDYEYVPELIFACDEEGYYEDDYYEDDDTPIPPTSEVSDLLSNIEFPLLGIKSFDQYLDNLADIKQFDHLSKTGETLSKQIAIQMIIQEADYSKRTFKIADTDPLSLFLFLFQDMSQQEAIDFDHNEYFIDQGCSSDEFFGFISWKLLAMEYFVYKDNRLVPNTRFKDSKLYLAIGKFLGFAYVKGLSVGIPFGNSFFKVLSGQKPELSDMIEEFPELYQELSEIRTTTNEDRVKTKFYSLLQKYFGITLHKFVLGRKRKWLINIKNRDKVVNLFISELLLNFQTVEIVKGFKSIVPSADLDKMQVLKCQDRLDLDWLEIQSLCNFLRNSSSLTHILFHKFVTGSPFIPSTFSSSYYVNVENGSEVDLPSSDPMFHLLFMNSSRYDDCEECFAKDLQMAMLDIIMD